MASHRKTNAPTLLSLSKRQWIRIVAIAAAIVMVVAAGIVSRNFYIGRGRGTTVNEYSATDLAGSSVSRSNNRADLRGADANTSYVTVKINGKSRFVLGDNFTDVKSVLDAGNITLEPEDSVTPALTTKVDESTVISISRADTQAETSETAIAFNTVKKETTSCRRVSRRCRPKVRKACCRPPAWSLAPRARSSRPPSSPNTSRKPLSTR